MNREFSHVTIDRINAAQDRQMAAKLCRDHSVLMLARRNLQRWMARDRRRVRPAFQEWHRILTRLSRIEIAHMLRSDTPMARRLRQSSPLAGLVSEAERRALRLRHEKA